ncbi:MAG: DNA translocase FtsK 4TM domain-containing protein [Actinomycetota bacterium]|nr:DNA translocase FtsK 4TM domain-containing protein [Actinomycetota bacterium]
MPNRRQQNSREIYGVAVIALGLLVTLSLFQAAGWFGSYVLIGLQWAVGSGRYILAVFLLVLGALFFTKNPEESLEKTTLGFALLTLTVTVALHLRVAESQAFKPAYVWANGGIVGAAVSALLKRLVGLAGSYVLVAAGAVVSLLFVTGASLREITQNIAASAKSRQEAGGRESPGAKALRPRPAVIEHSGGLDEETVIMPRPIPVHILKISKSQEDQAALGQLAMVDDADGDGSTYRLPPVSLLKRSPAVKGGGRQSEKEQIAVLEQTLRDFDIEAVVERVVKGPTVTRFELQLASGIKVNRIVGLADDIALALASADIRVLAPIPGRSAVGIEVPNAHRELVTLGDIMHNVPTNQGGPLLVPIGKDITGQAVLANIGDMPHLLIAGATGSGKSVSVNGILMSLLLRARPDQVKLILIDPKRVELNLYNDIPHLLVPVVTGPKDAALVLSWAVGEMEARYQLMADAKVRNITGYNEIVAERFSDREPLAYIVIVIDELADLMMVAAGDVEDAICRLAQMARAVGIHLVVATQRPAANIITGQIKANIICRIAFAVSSQVDSRVVLDANGAEKLVGKGDMLYQSQDSAKARRLQGAFVTEQEVELVVDFIKKQAKPEYKREILAEKKAKPEIKFEDDLFDEALEMVVMTGQASTSSLQRRLRVGYARAARLVDMLEQRGLVGPADGSKPRAVLITREELDELRGVETGT